RGLLLRVDLSLPRHRDRTVHADLRNEPGGRLGGARDRAARRQPADPAELGVRRAGAARVRADRAALGLGGGIGGVAHPTWVGEGAVNPLDAPLTNRHNRLNRAQPWGSFRALRSEVLAPLP